MTGKGNIPWHQHEDYGTQIANATFIPPTFEDYGEVSEKHLPEGARIFLAHPSSASREELNEWKVQVVEGWRELTGQHLPGSAVVPARECMRQNMGSIGGWIAWYAWVAAARDVNGAPYYAFLVCPKQWVGRRTQAIVEQALRAGKRVYFLSDGALVPVVHVQLDEEYELDMNGEPLNQASAWKLIPRAEEVAE